METRVAYCTLNLKDYRQQTTRLTHTVSIDETWVSFYRPLEKDQTKEWRKPGEKKQMLHRRIPWVLSVC